MATRQGETVDGAAVVRGEGPAKKPDGYWLGSAADRELYWRRRATTAEARCQALEEQLEQARRGSAGR